jgi:hypothetical protein
MASPSTVLWIAFFCAVAACTVTVGSGSLSFFEEHPLSVSKSKSGIRMDARKNVDRIVRIIMPLPSCMI